MLTDILNMKRKMDEQAVPEVGRIMRVTPGQLYELCDDVQRGTYIDAPSFKDLGNCKHALAVKNWEIAMAAMPRKVYGIAIELVVPNA